MFKFVGNLNWISSRLESLSSQFSWPESVFFCKIFSFLSLSLISSLFSEKVVCVCLSVIIYFLQISRYPLNTSEPRYWTFFKNTKLLETALLNLGTCVALAFKDFFLVKINVTAPHATNLWVDLFWGSNLNILKVLT